MVESVLSAVHDAARMGEYGGMTLPSSYGDPARERNAVRTGGGIIDLSNRGLIRFSGRDRLSFLQGMVSNDARRLEPGAGIYATILEPKGHVLHDLTLYAFEESYLADVEPETERAISRHLDRFVIREKVTISPEGESWARIGLSGPKATELLSVILPEIPEIPAPFGCASMGEGDAEILVFRKDFTGETGYSLSVRPESAVSLWMKLRDAGAIPFGQEALEILRTEAGIPRWGVDFNAETFPIEAGLFFGISRDKGCYVGQEVIERIASRGHANRRLLPIRFDPCDSPPTRAALRREGKEVGRVTSVVYSPEAERYLGLAFLRREAAPGESLQAVWDGGETRAEPLSRPLFGSGLPPAITDANPEW